MLKCKYCSYKTDDPVNMSDHSVGLTNSAYLDDPSYCLPCTSHDTYTADCGSCRIRRFWSIVDTIAKNWFCYDYNACTDTFVFSYYAPDFDTTLIMDQEKRSEATHHFMIHGPDSPVFLDIPIRK